MSRERLINPSVSVDLVEYMVVNCVGNSADMFESVVNKIISARI